MENKRNPMKGKKPGRTYYWQCGHRTTYTVNRMRRGSRICPICNGGYIMAIRLNCRDCGKLLGFYGAAFANKLYCEPCRKRHLTLNTRTYIEQQLSLKDTEPTVYSKPEPMRHHDCKFYESECLIEKAFQNKKLDCTGCQRYEKIDILEMIAIPTRDSFTQTITHAMPRIR